MRFPEFSGEWKKCTLGEIGKGFDYGMNAAAKPFDGQHKYIRITDIDESSAAYIDKDVVSPDGELQDSYLVKANDILLARTGASTGKSYLYDNKDGILYFAGFLIRVNIPSDNAYFVFSQLHLSRYRKWIGIMSARSGQPGVNSQEYSNYPIYLPKIEEQTKIAKLLKLVDERIAAQNKIIEDLKKLKSAISVQLLSGLFPLSRKEQWREMNLGDITENFNRRNKDRSSYPMYSVTNTSGFSPQNEIFDGRRLKMKTSQYTKLSRKENLHIIRHVSMSVLLGVTTMKTCV